jgi:hypothetical protein
VLTSFPKNHSQGKGQVIIKCECGFSILFIPNLKMMAKAIEAHAAEHAEKEKDLAKAASEQERIETDLVTQTLNAAAETC